MILALPLAGMQEDLCSAPEFEVFAGGAAGPGKSYGLMLAICRYIENGSYRALILRASFPELQELMDRADEMFPGLGAKWNENDKRWTFPSGATIEFGYLSTWAEVKRYRGQEFAFIGYDEIGDLPQERTWVFLATRCRTKDRAIPPRLRCTANPGGVAHAWLKRRYVDTCGEDGAKRYADPKTGLVRRFLPGRLRDNPALLANNPTYVAQLRGQSETVRRQLEDGDWEAGKGSALSELSEAVHIVKPFQVPDYWPRWGVLDWGFNHPYSFGLLVRNEDGDVYLVDSLHGRLLLDHEIAERVLGHVTDLRTGAVEQGDMRPRFTVAGRDCWGEYRARDGGGLTTADTLTRAGLPLMRADDSRVTGFTNLRAYIAWKGMGKDGEDGRPRFRMFDTPGNRKTFQILQNMVLDPDNAEDVLKQDYDDSATDASGNNDTGDDAYDMVRMGLMVRPLAVKKPQQKPKASPNTDAEFDRFMQHANARQRVGHTRGF